VESELGADFCSFWLPMDAFFLLTCQQKKHAHWPTVPPSHEVVWDLCGWKASKYSILRLGSPLPLLGAEGAPNSFLSCEY
jgi:hypothetical protein